MDINKAIRKQEKSNKRFLFFLGFIFFVMPLTLLLAQRFNLFFITYLAVIELLVLFATLASMNANYISYYIDGHKIRLKFARFGQEINIICDKVALVLAEGNGSEMNIVILTTSKFRNKRVNAVDDKFLKLHPYLSSYYYKLKKLDPEVNYFYIIVTKGQYHKYKLLDLIYRNCVKAYFTEETVQKIKEYRSL